MRKHLPFSRGTCAGIALLTGAKALGAPTQEDVFKSISDNVGQSTDPRRVLAFLIAGVAIVVLLAVFSQWRKREVQPKVLNHQGKLLRELSSAIALKPAELKQLKMLADEQKVLSPMTLMLCPSILAKSVKESGAKVDRRTVLQIARKIS